MLIMLPCNWDSVIRYLTNSCACYYVHKLDVSQENKIVGVFIQILYGAVKAQLTGNNVASGMLDI